MRGEGGMDGEWAQVSGFWWRLGGHLEGVGDSGGNWGMGWRWVDGGWDWSWGWLGCNLKEFLAFIWEYK